MSDLLDDRAGVEEVTEKERPAGSEDEDEDEDEDFEDGDETKEGASGQDSSEEEEGPDDYDYDDKFLVREDEDEDGDGAAEGEAQPPAGAAKHAKKKRRHRELVLEDDDYDLLEENTGIRRARPAAHRRIKKARDADRGLGREGGAQALQEELFGAELEDLEDEDAEAAPSAPTAPPGRAAPGPGARAGDEFDAEEEDEDDWIVDDFEGAEDEGAAAAAGAERRRRRRAMREGVPDIDPDALDEANDIFGDVSDLLAMYEDRKAAGAREAGEEALDEGAEEVDAEEFSDEEVAEALRLQREERRRGSAARRMERAVDPSLLERHFLTARDDAIRDADLPERLQLADDPTPRDWDLGACAAWVTARLAEDPGVAGQLVRAGVREVEGPPPAWHGGEAWRAGELEGGLRSTADRRGLYAGHERGEEGAARGLPPGALPALNDAVAAALEEVYHRHREVPTIGMYAKERVAELLVLRRTDEPYFTKECAGCFSLVASRTYPAGSIQPRDRVIRRWDVLHAGAGAGPPPGLATLIDIQFEFARPYGELRPKAKRLKEEELFWLCLGETPETLAAGKKVEARVRYVTAGVAFVSLPDLGNIDATIQAGNVSGSHGEVDCRDFMKQGDNLTARIIFLDPAEWRIELSTTSQALNDDAAWEQRLLCSREPYYVPLTLAEKAAAERSRRPAKPAFTPRQIRHPLFENISMNEAAKRLMEEGRPVGSAIFRPSHKGTRNIILSLRMPGGQVWHLDILEGPKVGALYRTSGFTVNLGRVFFRGVSVAGEEPGVYRNVDVHAGPAPMIILQGKGTGQLQLGTPLNMEVIPGKKREVYEELDEVVSRFVEPFGLHCQALQRFRHWRDAAWEAASEELVALKAGVPANQAVYCLGVEPRQPGMFYLGYVLGRTPHREFFVVTHRGFHFRKHDYRTVEHMVNQFKKAPRGDSFTTPGARHAAAQPGAGAEPQQPQPPQQPPQPPAEAVRPHYGAHSYPGASTQAYDYPPYPPQYQYPQAGNPYPAYAAGAGVAPGPPPAVNPAVGYGYAAPAWQPPLPQG
ncbi:hypothetical protein APUTEX25_000871 [Auxenochlorella protothecoides]|uniref:S1 motif domain-containing protein n=1 Tax=Auxenochlorella protothecoides TaxID=3075 RepID=A0A3M7KTQ6_AUXPR|nr:hypothetical protein APUTEX25_000871 [Auxenochlorella protothecoides]|eukprot:RMZ52752.1 hypothetical protein APUTEX25_000871 [Auxenochlorella protothecoides]